MTEKGPGLSTRALLSGLPPLLANACPVRVTERRTTVCRR